MLRVVERPEGVLLAISGPADVIRRPGLQQRFRRQEALSMWFAPPKIAPEGGPILSEEAEASARGLGGCPADFQ